jgi:hypothetical protein
MKRIAAFYIEHMTGYRALVPHGWLLNLAELMRAVRIVRNVPAFADKA